MSKCTLAFQSQKSQNNTQNCTAKYQQQQQQQQPLTAYNSIISCDNFGQLIPYICVCLYVCCSAHPVLVLHSLQCVCVCACVCVCVCVCVALHTSPDTCIQGNVTAIWISTMSVLFSKPDTLCSMTDR